MVSSTDLGQLTRTEREILAYLREGVTVGEIARKLRRAENLIEGHRRGLFQTGLLLIHNHDSS